MNENIFKLMRDLLSDGGSLDWKRLSSYIEDHELDISEEELIEIDKILTL